MRKKKPVENKDFEFAKPMGVVSKEAREKAKYTQGFVSESTGVDTRTIMNIENGEGNPTMEKLYPLVRFYGIDPRVFFTPKCYWRPRPEWICVFCWKPAPNRRQRIFSRL